jgi:6-phosphogluconate dehydrogenase
MELGMVGAGRMGGGMAQRLLRGGHTCRVFDRDPKRMAELAGLGARPAHSLRELAAALAKPRAVWLMLPAGEATELAFRELSSLLEPGDALVDGGNTHFADDLRRARHARTLGIDYIDVGTSGGVHGLERGFCLMVGGGREPVQRLDPLFRTLAPGRGEVPANVRGTAGDGYLHCGPAGSGHFVKMVHNGIEYGLMQAYAEGFALLRGARGREAESRYELDLAAISELWRRGSVIGSWLLDLTSAALAEDPELARFSGRVEDSGEGRWALQAALEESVPMPVLAASLFARFRSRQQSAFADQTLSAMRAQFGGHSEMGAARPPAREPGRGE